MSEVKPDKRPFAVFDIDGTVIRWQLYHSIVTELARQGCLSSGAEQAINEARMTWKKRAHNESFKAYEATLVQTYLGALKGLSVEDYLSAVDVVFDEYKDQVYTYTRDLIRSLKSQGYRLFAISGSHNEIIAKLANYYGFDDYKGANFIQKNGFFTGKFDSPFHGKAEPLRELMSMHNLTFSGSIAVGDTGSDISMLELVEQPIAFNPNRELFEFAQSKGWKIVIERKNMVYQLKATNGSYVLA